MRLLLLINLTAFAVTGVAVAEEPPMSLPPVSIDPQKNTLPPALDLGPQQGSRNNNVASGNAGNVNPGNGKGGYDDLNRRLRGEVNRVNPPITNQPPLDARSPDTRIGVINLPAVQQQYGQNFGISAHPYRPPPLVYAPIGRH